VFLELSFFEEHDLPAEAAQASPVLPERAVLFASPPLASWSWLMSPPSAELLLVAVASAEELALPDVAEPFESPSSPPPVVLLSAELLLRASPDVASVLLLFEAFPLPATCAWLWPPLPPLADASASPELPERAVVSPSSSPPPLELAVALPVGPVVAVLAALPPLASWSWLTSPP